MARSVHRALLTRALACGVCLAAFAPTAASADIFNVIFTTTTRGTDLFTFDTAAPVAAYRGLYIEYDSQRGYNFFFLNTATFSGSGFFTERDRYFTGPQLYTGTETAPVFTPGTYALGSYQGGPSGSLTLTRADAPGAPGGAAPEVGLGLLAMLAAAAALAMTRLRMPWLRRTLA